MAETNTKYKLKLNQLRKYILSDRFEEVLIDEDDRDTVDNVCLAIADSKGDIDHLLSRQPRLLMLCGYLREKYLAKSVTQDDEYKRVVADQGDKVRAAIVESKRRATEKLVAQLVTKRKSVIEAKRLARVALELSGHLAYFYAVADSRKYTLQELSKRERQREEEDYSG